VTPGLLVILCVVALAVGVALGWLARAARAAEAQARAAELPPLRLMVDGLREERDQAQRELAGVRAVTARLPVLERELGEARARGEALAGEVAALRRGEEAHAAQVAELKEMEAKLAARFGELAGQALGDAQGKFLARAEERFAQAGEQGEAKLRLLLSPVEETLKRYEAGLARVEQERADSYGALKEAVGQLAAGNETVRRETARLTGVLRSSPKHRGRWGEEQLRTILESAGLAENVDFALQASVADGERQLRPDCVIHLPGGRCMVVDVKCPLVHFEAAFDEEDEARRGDLLLQHANAMRAYANDLGRKGYWRQFDLSPEFVVMFIPGEHFLAAAAERAPDLIEGAFRQGVIVASTINMLALAKVMAGLWRQEHLAHQAHEVAEAGKELYKRLATMGGHVGRMGRALGQATGAYNDFVGSLESQVLTQARRFEALKVDTGGKAIDAPPVVEAAVRPLTKLAVDAN